MNEGVVFCFAYLRPSHGIDLRYGNWVYDTHSYDDMVVVIVRD